MDKKFYRIDELSRGSLGNLEKDPPPMSFDKIRKRVFWYSLWSLSIGSFLRRFWSIPAAAALVAVILYQIPSAGNPEQPGNQAIAESRTINALQHNGAALPDGSSISYKSHENTSTNAAPITSHKANSFAANAGNQSVEQIAANTIADNNNNYVNTETTRISETVSDKSMNLAQNNEIIKAVTEKPGLSMNPSMEVLPTPHRIPIRFNMLPDSDRAGVLPVSDINTKFANRIINWSVSFAAGAAYSGSMFTPVSENQQDINREFSLSSHFGLETRADFGKWFISAGLHQTAIDNRYSSDHLLYNARTELEQNLINQFWMTDSIGYWHYTYVSDTAIHVLDSVWAWNIDSTLIQEFDTVSIAKYDTLQNARWKRNVKYLEIPLMLGKTFSVNRLSFGLSGGFGIGLLYFTEGEYYQGNGNNQAFITITSAETKKICFSFVAAGSVSYLFNERWAIEFSPWYRKMLSPVFSGELQGSQKPWSAGLSAGLRFYF